MGACSQRDVFSLFIIRRQPSMKQPGGGANGEWLVISPIFLSILGKMFGT